MAKSIQTLTTTPEFTNYTGLTQGNPIKWGGGVVKNLNFQLGLNASNPSQMSVTIMDDPFQTSVYDTSLIVGQISSVPLGSYDWYGIIQGIDYQVDTKTLDTDNYVGTEMWQFNLQSLRSVVNTVTCLLSPIGDHLSVFDMKTSEYILNVYDEAKGVGDLTDFFWWKNDRGMPWYTFKRTLEESNMKFSMKSSVFQVVWQIPENSTLNPDNADSGKYIDLWCNLEMGGLGDIVDNYLQQQECVWVDEVTVSDTIGVDYDFNIWIIERGTVDSKLEESKINNLINSSDSVWDSGKLCNVYKVVWGDETRNEPTRKTVFGSNIEFFHKFNMLEDGSASEGDVITIPLVPSDITTNLYDLGKGKYTMFPYFGWIDYNNNASYGISLDILDNNEINAQTRKIANKPFIRKLNEPSSIFVFEDGIVDSTAVGYWRNGNDTSPFTPTFNAAGSIKGKISVDPLLYYFLQLKNKTPASYYDAFFDTLNVKVVSELFNYTIADGLGSASNSTINTFIDIWEYIHEPISADIDRIFVAKGTDLAPLSLHNGQDTSFHIIEFLTENVPSIVDVNNLDDVSSYGFWNKETLYEVSSTNRNLWECYNRIMDVGQQFAKLAENFLTQWIIVCPQNVNVSKLNYRIDETVPPPFAGQGGWPGDGYLPERTDAQYAKELVRCEIANEGWPWSQINGSDYNAHIPVFGQSFDGRASSIFQASWNQENSIFGHLNYDNFKLPPIAVWTIPEDNFRYYNLGSDGPIYSAHNSVIYVSSPISIESQFEIIITDHTPPNTSMVVMKKAVTTLPCAAIKIPMSVQYEDFGITGILAADNLELDRNKGVYVYRPLPDSLYIPFICSDVRYGPFTNATTAEEVTNFVNIDVEVNEAFSPWAVGGDDLMFRMIHWYLQRNKMDLNDITRLQISAYDYFRPLVNTSEKLRLKPGLNVWELSDTLLDNISATFNDGGWDMNLSFVSYARQPGTLDQYKQDDIYRMKNYITRTQLDAEKQHSTFKKVLARNTFFGTLKTDLDTTEWERAYNKAKNTTAIKM